MKSCCAWSKIQNEENSGERSIIIRNDHKYEYTHSDYFIYAHDRLYFL